MGVWGGTQENNNKNARYRTVFCSVPVVCCDLVPLKLPIKPSLIQKNKAATELRTSEKIQLKDCKGSMSLQSNSEGKRTLFLLSELLLKRNKYSEISNGSESAHLLDKAKKEDFLHCLTL